MRAFLVSVDYTDLLALTLPYNRHHFHEVFVVTSTADAPNVRPVADACRAEVIATDLFYANGADFNKWAGLEFALDHAGRKGWICLMDADVAWPKGARVAPYLRPGYILSPLRRVCDPAPPAVPPEAEWSRHPIHPNRMEWAGYSQVFHSDDPALGPPPWHQTDWRHAGGADSFFQAKWPPGRKVRPPWHALHLGPCGANWYGRAAPHLDGTAPAGAELRRAKVAEIWRQRRQARAEGRAHEQFAPEKLP